MKAKMLRITEEDLKEISKLKACGDHKSYREAVMHAVQIALQKSEEEK